MARNRSSQRSRRALVGEEDEERIVARQRALLFAQARLVDGLGDDAGGPGRARQDEDQAAPADRDRDVARGCGASRSSDAAAGRPATSSRAT